MSSFRQNARRERTIGRNRYYCKDIPTEHSTWLSALSGGLPGGGGPYRQRRAFTNRGGWKAYWADAFAARSIKRATSSGLETYTAWLPGTSIVSLPARLAMLRSRSGLMLRSRVATSAQLFF